MTIKPASVTYDTTSGNVTAVAGSTSIGIAKTVDLGVPEAPVNGSTYGRKDAGWVILSPFVNPMTTIGDIITGGASGSPQRLGVGSSGQVLTVVSGTPAWAAASGGGSSGLTITSKSADYTFVLGDANNGFLHPSADTTARTFTIPANSSVPFPVGTCITITNQPSAGVVNIAITTDTLYQAGTGTTGTRQITASGIATLLKEEATRWKIVGAGIL